MGLSPRLRGNPNKEVAENLNRGSIPAPAGEPPSPTTPSTRSSVYPRACGGTSTAARASAWAWGLSPRLRGNRSTMRACSSVLRSIPAPAGEPVRAYRGAANGPVYPRACGGTGHNPPENRHLEGLSPRLRGNLLIAPWGEGHCGSIPAPAGEPPRSRIISSRSSVYPRACGGTL